MNHVKAIYALKTTSETLDFDSLTLQASGFVRLGVFDVNEHEQAVVYQHENYNGIQIWYEKKGDHVGYHAIVAGLEYHYADTDIELIVSDVLNEGNSELKGTENES